MTIYLDSANLTEIQTALEWAFLGGVTTNPLLMAREQIPVADILAQIAALGFAEVFYQPHKNHFDGVIDEIKAVQPILGDDLIVKLPPTPLSFKIIKTLAPEVHFCVTAVFSPEQALLAGEAGAKYVAVYVNRAQRLLGDGQRLVSEVSDILSTSETRLVAASLKTPQEVVQAVLSGAHDVTLPFRVLSEMFDQAITQQVIEDFAANGAGILTRK